MTFTLHLPAWLLYALGALALVVIGVGLGIALVNWAFVNVGWRR